MATTSAASATTAATAPTAPTAALGERHIGRANGNPEGAETCGKSQDDKPFADRAHDVSFP
jgi:hypothetical protein